MPLFPISCTQIEPTYLDMKETIIHISFWHHPKLIEMKRQTWSVIWLINIIVLLMKKLNKYHSEEEIRNKTTILAKKNAGICVEILTSIKHEGWQEVKEKRTIAKIIPLDLTPIHGLPKMENSSIRKKVKTVKKENRRKQARFSSNAARPLSSDDQAINKVYINKAIRKLSTKWTLKTNDLQQTVYCS